MPNVWLVQESRKPVDLSSAQRYGEVRSLLSTRDNPSLTPGPSLVKMVKLLRQDYSPNDYFAAFVSADPIAPFLAGLAIQQLGYIYEPIRWLRWERELDTFGQRIPNSGFYVPTQIDVRSAA